MMTLSSVHLSALVSLLSMYFYFFLSLRPQPRSTLFPYTTLFRSLVDSDTRRLIGLLSQETEIAAGDLNAVGNLPDRKSTRLNSSHTVTSYAVFCLKKKTNSTLTSQLP